MYLTQNSYRTVAIGMAAMGSGDGSNNVAIGDNSMWLGSNGIGNIAIGSSSIGNGRAGTDNIAIGRASLYWTTGV